MTDMVPTTIENDLLSLNYLLNEVTCEETDGSLLAYIFYSTALILLILLALTAEFISRSLGLEEKAYTFAWLDILGEEASYRFILLEA